jgi:hypothetical protein
MISPQTCNMERLDQRKDDLGLRMPGVYSIPCECTKVYIGQSGQSKLETKNTINIYDLHKEINLQ